MEKNVLLMGMEVKESDRGWENQFSQNLIQAVTSDDRSGQFGLQK